MKHHIKIGLIIGAIGLVLNSCVAFIVGFCGPVTSVVAGAVAGYLSVQNARGLTKKEGAKLGAISAAVAGALILVGQVFGAVAALFFIQQFNLPLILGGTPPTPADGPLVHLMYYAIGAGAGFVIGLIGLGLAALVGYGIAYWMTSEEAASEAVIEEAPPDEVE